MDIIKLTKALEALKLQARAVQANDFQGDREMLEEAQTAMEELKTYVVTIYRFLRNDTNITIETADNEWVKNMISSHSLEPV